MNKKQLSQTIAHHSMAMVGGFYGIYALLLRHETFGSSTTSNLIYMFAAGFRGDMQTVLIRIGAMIMYILGVVFATLTPKMVKDKDIRYLSIIIDIISFIVLAFIGPDVDPVLALYPIFFATAFQWLAFTEAAGFNSATIFSTNNTRQCFSALTEYLCSKDKKWLIKCEFFAGTLILFHIGVVYAYILMVKFGLKSIYFAIIPAVITAYFVHKDRMTPAD